MTPQDIVEAIRQFSEIFQESRDEYSPVASERALGAAIGALIAVVIFAWAAPPAIAGAFLFAALTITGRTIGTSSGLKKLRAAPKPSWDHIELLTRTLRQLGVRDEWLGLIVKTIMETGPSVELLNDPAHILRLLPEEVFSTPAQPQVASPPSSVSPALQPGDDHPEERKLLNGNAE
jgi:hypothetical protein